MIKEKLKILYDRNIDNEVSKNIDFINNNYSESDLSYILSNSGYKISENIILRYYYGHGFVCQDLNEKYFGKSPLSQNVERFLNRLD
jgi:hypothetical protein